MKKILAPFEKADQNAKILSQMEAKLFDSGKREYQIYIETKLILDISVH